MYWWWYTKSMQVKRLVIIVFVLAIIIIIAIFSSSKHLKDHPLNSLRVATSTQNTIRVVSLSHSYKRGVYTIQGSITVPNICYAVSTHTSLIPSTTPQRIRLILSVPNDTGRCLQLVATTTFSVTQRAKKNASVEVYLNGVLATSTKL